MAVTEAVAELLAAPTTIRPSPQPELSGRARRPLGGRAAFPRAARDARPLSPSAAPPPSPRTRRWQGRCRYPQARKTEPALRSACGKLSTATAAMSAACVPRPLTQRRVDVYDAAARCMHPRHMDVAPQQQHSTLTLERPSGRRQPHLPTRGLSRVQKSAAQPSALVESATRPCSTGVSFAVFFSFPGRASRGWLLARRAEGGVWAGVAALRVGEHDFFRSRA